MKKLVLGVLLLSFGFTFTSCRQQTKKEVIKEKKVQPEKKDQEGILERTGKKVDKKVNKEVNKKIDDIDDKD